MFSSFFGYRFNPDLCKANLKMGISRAKLTKNRLQNSQKVAHKEIAVLLKSNKEDKARIRAEQCIQDHKLELALDILETMCDLLVTRMSFISSESTCAPDLVSTVHSVLFCHQRTGIEELGVVRKQFEIKFGKPWVQSAVSNSSQEVHFKLVNLLSVSPPEESDIVQLMDKVAKDYGVHWIAPIVFQRDALFPIGHGEEDFIPEPGGAAQIRSRNPVLGQFNCTYRQAEGGEFRDGGSDSNSHRRGTSRNSRSSGEGDAKVSVGASQVSDMGYNRRTEPLDSVSSSAPALVDSSLRSSNFGGFSCAENDEYKDVMNEEVPLDANIPNSDRSDIDFMSSRFLHKMSNSNQSQSSNPSYQSRHPLSQKDTNRFNILPSKSLSLSQISTNPSNSSNQRSISMTRSSKARNFSSQLESLPVSDACQHGNSNISTQSSSKQFVYNSKGLIRPNGPAWRENERSTTSAVDAGKLEHEEEATDAPSPEKIIEHWKITSRAQPSQEENIFYDSNRSQYRHSGGEIGTINANRFKSFNESRITDESRLKDESRDNREEKTSVRQKTMHWGRSVYEESGEGQDSNGFNNYVWNEPEDAIRGGRKKLEEKNSVARKDHLAENVLIDDAKYFDQETKRSSVDQKTVEVSDDNYNYNGNQFYDSSNVLSMTTADSITRRLQNL